MKCFQDSVYVEECRKCAFPVLLHSFFLMVLHFLTHARTTASYDGNSEDEAHFTALCIFMN